MKAGGRYLSPQLNTLCPSKVQNTAMPKPASRFTGPQPVRACSPARAAASTVPAAER